MNPITVEQIVKWDPCSVYCVDGDPYAPADPKRVRAAMGGDSIDPLAGLDLPLPPDHIIWTLCQPGAVPSDVVHDAQERTVERAIRRSVGKSGCQAWETWAVRWMSGEDKTAEAAARARAAAWAWAAEVAAEAAEAAAWARAEAAAWAAWAAEVAWEAAKACDASWTAWTAARAAEAAEAAEAAAEAEYRAQIEDFRAAICAALEKE